MVKTIPDILHECQRTFASHKKGLVSMRKIQNKDPEKFMQDFLQYLNRILVVFKREPAVERLIQFVVQFATFLEDGKQPNESFALFLISYLLEYTTAKEKAVRFRTTQLISNLINGLSEEAELEYASWL